MGDDQNLCVSSLRHSLQQVSELHLAFGQNDNLGLFQKSMPLRG